MPDVTFAEKKHKLRLHEDSRQPQTAIIYCEGNFGSIDGKTANGLIRYSEKYKIIAVIDSTKSKLDSGIVLDDKPNDILPFLTCFETNGLIIDFSSAIFFIHLSD